MKTITMKLAISLFASVLATTVTTGCTVDVGDVRHRPPAIPETVNTTLDSKEFGTITFNDDLDMDGISFFFWPNGLIGKDLEDKVYSVNMESMAIDTEFETLRAGVRADEKAFAEKKCEKFSTAPGVTVRDEIAWRELDVNSTEEDKVLFAECKAAREHYTALTSEGYTKIAGHKEKILKEVGPENWQDVNKKTSSVAILAVDQNVQVTVTLKIGKITYSTLPEKVSGKPAQLITNAGYIVPRRLLHFQLNELDEDRQPTGSVYQFTLERAADYLKEMARFTGDARLVDKDGKILRNGSFQLIGTVRD